jgi:hypothetical protein
VTVAGSGGGRLAILPLGPAGLEVDVVQGETQGPQGWVALLSGVKEPAPVVRYRRQGPAPAAFVTVLVPLTSRQAGTPRLEAIEVLDEATGAREGRSAAGRLQFAGGGEDFLVPLAERPALLPGRRLRAGSLITDARLAAVGWGMDGRPRSAAVAGGSFIERGGAELFRAPAGVARPAALWLEGRGLLSL